MWVTYRNCPNCNASAESNTRNFLCASCLKPLVANISEEEFRQNGHLYIPAQVREASEEDKAWYAEMEQHIADMGNKPFRFIRTNAKAPASFNQFPAGFLWLALFCLLCIGLFVFLFIPID